MSTEVITTGFKRNGKTTIRNEAQFRADVAALKDGELIYVVRRAHATRKAAANAYYWAVIVDRLCRFIEGMTPDEIHEFLKAKFLPKKAAAVDGNGRIVAEFVIGGSTTKLNGVEFYEYCDRICQWAAEEPLNLYIPPPDPNWKDNLVACERCKGKFSQDELSVREVEWSDGGQAGTEEIEVCQACAKRIDSEAA